MSKSSIHESPTQADKHHEEEEDDVAEEGDEPETGRFEFDEEKTEDEEKADDEDQAERKYDNEEYKGEEDEKEDRQQDEDEEDGQQREELHDDQEQTEEEEEKLDEDDEPGKHRDGDYDYYEDNNDTNADANDVADLSSYVVTETTRLGTWASRQIAKSLTRMRQGVTAVPTEEKPYFTPIDFEWQKRIGKRLGLMIRRRHFPVQHRVPLTKPKDVIRTQPDGNCFFRAMSVAVTGSSADHEEFRTKLVNFMTHPICAAALLPHHDFPTTADYIAASKMNYPGTWASDTEILAAATLLKTHIYMYAKEGRAMRWMKFPADTLVEQNKAEKTCIYLCHTGGCHYDYVTAVTVTKTRSPLPEHDTHEDE